MVETWAIVGLSIAFCFGLAVVLALPWLRVAQREHYIPGWVGRIALGWGAAKPLTWWPLVLATVGFYFPVYWLAWQGVSYFFSGLAIALGLAAFWPWGLGFRGRSAKLQWTSRLRRLSAIWVFTYILGQAGLILIQYFLLQLFVSIFSVEGWELGYAGAYLWFIALAISCVFVPVFSAPFLMDLSLLIAKPIEKSISKKWLIAAQKKLKQVRPQVVAITGSYGKTSTKGYAAHLLATKFQVVPSPASFNNLLGLSRAVNDKLAPGTEVFVAEMGVYGEGEIRELSKSFPPDIAAITVIGESHLSRMKNRETVLRAKSEIVEQAKTVVLPIDDPDLAALANDCEGQGKRVVRVSASGKKADVIFDPAKETLAIGSEKTNLKLPTVQHAVNLVVAVGIAHALGIPLKTFASRLENLPTAAHRAEVQTAPSGALVIDDSYNANPVGAASAITGGADLANQRTGNLVVVTPGLIEFGDVQKERNRELAEQVKKVGGELFVVGYTNRKALLSGFPEAKVFKNRQTAMAAAFERAGGTGVILVENDLPDHYV